MNCYLSAAAGFALLGGSVWTLTATHSEKAKFQQVLTPDQQKIYQGIVAERRNHYLQGLAIGLVLSYFLQSYLKVRGTFHSITLFLAITLFTTALYYSLAPKSDFMLRHLKTPEQVEAWLDVYKSMKYRYLFGIVLGALSSVPFSRVLC